MKGRLALIVVALLALAAPALAQVPVPGTARAIGWTHDGLQTDGYAVIVDGTRTVVQPTCTGDGAARTCEVPFPALTPGRHTIVIEAFNAAGAAQSDPLAIDVFVQPAKPADVRILR